MFRPFSRRFSNFYGTQAILRDIAATQNFQIQGMNKVLEMNNFAKTADCIVEISRDIAMDVDNVPTSSPANAAPQASNGSVSLPSQMIVVLMASLSMHFLF